MKTLNLTFEDMFHSAMKHSAEMYNESLKKFIENAIKARLRAEDYNLINEDVQEYLKTKKSTSQHAVRPQIRLLWNTRQRRSAILAPSEASR